MRKIDQEKDDEIFTKRGVVIVLIWEILSLTEYDENRSFGRPSRRRKRVRREWFR